MNNSLTLCALGSDKWEAASEAGVQSRPGSHFKIWVEERRSEKPTGRATHGLTLHISPAT